MSMLSAQCDRLRRLADHLDERERGMDEYVQAMRKAADTIWHLRNLNLDTASENDNLKDESARLREERDKWKRDYEWLRARMDDVAESYKRIQEHDGRLYELVLYMWDFSCVVPDEPHTSKEELDYSVEVWRRMRELGIEVER